MLSEKNTGTAEYLKMMSSFNNFWNAENYMHVNWDFNNMDILNHATGYSF